MIGKVSRAAYALATCTISFELDLVPLRFERLPLKKMVNWLLTESSVAFKPVKPWGLPTILQVEPTNRCNLRCRICPVGEGLGRPIGDMDPKLFFRLVNELKDYLLLIMFWDWGEPFLNPAAYEMIQFARRAGLKVACSTNGHVFSNRNHAKMVVESGLDVLVFSVDGITQDTYQRFRNQGRLDVVLEGIRNVVGEKRRLRSLTPLINLRYIVTQHGQHEVPRVKEFACSLGIDVLTFRKFHFVPGTDSDYGVRISAEDDGASFVPSEAKYQLPVLSSVDRRPQRIARNPCKNLWNCPTVHWDGTICSCFMDYNGIRPLGSLNDNTLREIWYGKRYLGLRRAFRDHWRQLSLCGECASGFAGGDIGRQANAEAVFFPGPETANEA